MPYMLALALSNHVAEDARHRVTRKSRIKPYSEETTLNYGPFKRNDSAGFTRSSHTLSAVINYNKPTSSSTFQRRETSSPIPIERPVVAKANVCPRDQIDRVDLPLQLPSIQIYSLGLRR